MNKIPTYTLEMYPCTLFSHSLVTHCKSHNRKVKLHLIVDRFNKLENQKFHGKASHYHGGWFYEFFDNGQWAVGWNNQFVYYKDIVAVQWAGDQFSTRYFSWQCQSSVDNLAVSYNQKYKRWANPLRFLEDFFIPDEWEMFCEAPSEFAEGFNRQIDITEHYSKTYLNKN